MQRFRVPSGVTGFLEDFLEGGRSMAEHRPKREPTAALSDLVERTASVLLRRALRWCTDHAAAEDLVQSAYLKLLERQHELGGERPLLPWLLAVVDGLGRNERRRRTGVELTEPPRAPEIGPLERSAQRELELRLTQALAELSPGTRPVLEAVLVEELAPHQVADRLGIRQEASRVRLHRGLAQLRAKLRAWRVGGSAILAGLLGRRALVAALAVVSLSLLSSPLPESAKPSPWPVAAGPFDERSRDPRPREDPGSSVVPTPDRQALTPKVAPEAVGPFPPATPADTPSLVGRVRDARTSLPLEGVSLHLFVASGSGPQPRVEGALTSTGADGRFEYRGPLTEHESGLESLLFAVDRDGRVGYATLPSLDRSGPVETEIRIGAAAPLEVVVVEERTGLGVPGVLVECSPRFRPWPLDGGRTADWDPAVAGAVRRAFVGRTDEHGVVRLHPLLSRVETDSATNTSRDSSSWVRVRAEGHVSRQLECSVGVGSASSVRVALSSLESLSIRGSVRDARGLPVADAAILARSAGSREDVLLGESGADGRWCAQFSANDSVVLPLQLRCEWRGECVARAALDELEPNAPTTSIDFVVDGGSAKLVRVEDELGRAVAGATLEWRAGEADPIAGAPYYVPGARFEQAEDGSCVGWRATSLDREMPILRTDENGVAQVPNIPLDDGWLLVVPPEPWKDWSGVVRRPWHGDDREVRVNLRRQDEPRAVLHASVVAPSGVPVDPLAAFVAPRWHEDVEFTEQVGFEPAVRLGPGTVDVEELDRGEWVLWVRAEGFALASLPFVVQGEGRTDLRVEMPSAGRLIGRLDWRGAEPMPANLRIRAWREFPSVVPNWAGSSRLHADLELDEHGRFRADDLTPGRWLVRPGAGDVVVGVAGFDLRAGESTDLSIPALLGAAVRIEFPEPRAQRRFRCWFQTESDLWIECARGQGDVQEFAAPPGSYRWRLCWTHDGTAPSFDTDRRREGDLLLHAGDSCLLSATDSGVPVDPIRWNSSAASENSR